MYRTEIHTHDYLGGYETVLGQFVLEPVQAAGINVALFNGPCVLKQ
jgi:hypothetical protein